MNIGIDLGTSYSSVAAEVDGKIEMIRVSTGASAFGDSFSIPTAIYLDNGHVLLGQVALSKRKLSPSCFKSEFKRDLGTTTPYLIGSEEYLPEQLYTEFFLYFKEQAAKQMGEKIEKVYITHPANYGNNKKRLIEKAANNAGFFDIELVDEPTAAAAGYAQKNKIMDGDIILVYDLGGGTFDAALIKKTAKGYVHLTEPVGISQCGGMDFDRLIFENIIYKMTQSSDFDIDRVIKEKRFAAALSEISIQIKHQLSHAERHTESIAVGFDYFDYTIIRQEFEEMIRPLISNTCEKIKDIIKNSGLSASDIDRVLLVGGSSRVPLVQKMVYELLKKEVSFDADPELSVCKGAVSLGIVKHQDNIYEKKEEPVQDKNQGKEEKAQDKRQEDEKLKYRKNTEDEEKIIKEKKSQEEQKPEKIFEVKKDEAPEYPGRMKEIMKEVITGSYSYDGEWIYYMQPYDNNTLYKVKIDGTHKTKLSSNTVKPPIKVDKEWVYYNVLDRQQNQISCYRIKKDGGGETRISDEYTYGYAQDYAIKNGWLYFVNSFRRLRRVKTDGSSIVPIGLDKHVGPIAVGEEGVYYTCSSDSPENESLYFINFDGTSKKELCNKKAIVKAVFNNCIYYVTEERGLWRIHNNGKGNCRILFDSTLLDKYDRINIIDGWIYYKDNIYGSTNRVRHDGTNFQTVRNEMLQQIIESMKRL